MTLKTTGTTGKGVGFTIVHNPRATREFCRTLKKGIADLTPAMKLCAAIMHRSKKRTFDKCGMQPHWPALSPFTVRMRERLGKHKGHGQLKVYGRLYMSVQGYPHKKGLVWGSDDSRAKLLQDGGTAPAPKGWKRDTVTVPGRKFVRIYHWDHRKMTEIVRDFVDKSVHGKAVSNGNRSKR